jgi:GTP-binding protein HflX
MTQDPRRGRSGRRLTATVTDLEVDRQKAFLIGVVRSAGEAAEAETSLHELALLTDTAGSNPIGSVLVNRSRPNPGLLIGSGKAEELAEETKALDVDVVVFDNELTPAQQRNLQKIFECDVVDRVALILDIFAQHATSREGRVQVELAQHRYRLPRLHGRGVELSRLGGGIGTRGPGETQLETDRRRIQDRVAKLQEELRGLDKARKTRSKARRRAHTPVVTAVGYTNAGKSTLFNRLTSANVLVEDRLFATLDSTIRKLDIPGGPETVMSDTVGFVRRLPHELVEAFRSTLEEVAEADLLLHVVDATDEDPDRQIEVVRGVLAEIGAADIPELIVINKLDAADPVTVERLHSVYPGSVPISARDGQGIDDLLAAVSSALEENTVEVGMLIPYDQGQALALAHRFGDVLAQEHVDGGTALTVRLPKGEAYHFDEWVSDAL